MDLPVTMGMKPKSFHPMASLPPIRGSMPTNANAKARMARKLRSKAGSTI